MRWPGNFIIKICWLLIKAPGSQAERKQAIGTSLRNGKLNETLSHVWSLSLKCCPWSSPLRQVQSFCILSLANANDLWWHNCYQPKVHPSFNFHEMAAGNPEGWWEKSSLIDLITPRFVKSIQLPVKWHWKGASEATLQQIPKRASLLRWAHKWICLEGGKREKNKLTNII